MAASVIRMLGGFGLSRPTNTCFVPAAEDELVYEYEEDLRDEVEDSFEEEDEDATVVEAQISDSSSCDLYTEMTDRLLRFADLISSDVQRYFGGIRDLDTCELYTGRPCTKMARQHREYPDIIQVASSEKGNEMDNLGPLAELFQNTQVKKQGLPMIQRRLPSSFWTEPHPNHLSVSANISDVVRCSVETMTCNTSGPVISMGSANTPDFSDLLAHWASERDSTPECFSCEYQIP